MILNYSISMHNIFKLAFTNGRSLTCEARTIGLRTLGGQSTAKHMIYPGSDTDEEEESAVKLALTQPCV